MKAGESKATLEGIISARGILLNSILPEELVEIFLEFYRDRRAEDSLSEAEDGDMLLFEWGIYENILGPNFHFSLTRQFAIGDDADLFQLNLKLEYPPDENLAAIRPGNFWCHVPRDEQIREFKLAIRNSPAFKETRSNRPLKVSIDYFCAC